MIFLIFLIGVSLWTNVVIGYIAWQATQETRRTRAGAAAILAELEFLRKMARPMTIVNGKPVSFKSMIGNGLVRYETTKALERAAAELMAA
jgi:hypothetical protein